MRFLLAVIAIGVMPLGIVQLNVLPAHIVGAVLDAMLLVGLPAARAILTVGRSVADRSLAAESHPALLAGEL